MQQEHIRLISGCAPGALSAGAIVGAYEQPTGTALQGDPLAALRYAAATGDITAYFDLGVAYSTGSHGVASDLIEAHKWFNLAAVAGDPEAALCRHDVAEEMTAREIAEAQRRAREWIAATRKRAA